MRFFYLSLLFLSLTTPAWALTLHAPEAASVGQSFFARVELGETAAESVVFSWLGEEVAVPVTETATGREAKALLGVGLATEQGEHPLTVQAGSEQATASLDVTKPHFPEQHLKVDRKYTSLSQEALDRHWAEKKRTGQALAIVSEQGWPGCPLVRPVPGDVSSAFGLTRFFNGEPRKPHSGLDLRGAKGTPVKAAADGVVLLGEEHYFAGNSLYLDHGRGVVSMYFHLSEILVQPGEHVSAGQVVAKVGSTGRVTGPHLHFGLSVLGQVVDPTPLIGACPGL